MNRRTYYLNGLSHVSRIRYRVMLNTTSISTKSFIQIFVR